MTIARSTAITLGAQSLLLVLQLVSGVVTTRLLGREGYGELNLILTTAMLFATAFQFSLIYGIMHVWSTGAHEPGDVTRTVLRLGLIFGAAALVVQEVFVLTIGAPLFYDIGSAALHIGLLVTPALILVAFLELLLKLVNDIVGYNIGRVLPKVLAVLLILAFVLPGIVAAAGWNVFVSPAVFAGALVEHRFPLWLFLLLSHLGTAAGLLYAYLRLRPKLRSAEREPSHVTGSLARRILSSSWRAYPSFLALFLLSRIDYFVVSERLDSEALGIYAVAHALAELVTMIGFAINTAVLPYAASPDAALAHETTAESLRYNLLFSSMAALGCIALAWPLVLLYAGEAYSSAVLPLRLLVPGMVCYFLFGLYNVLVARHGWFRGSNIILGLAVVADFLGSLAVVDRYGLPGVAAVKTVVYMLVLLGYVIWFHRAGIVSGRTLFRVRASDLQVWRRIAGRQNSISSRLGLGGVPA